jgi:hypothetical protein
MLHLSETINQDDLHNPARDYANAQVEIGTVGWDDEDLWYEKGTDDNDGHTLVRVQLYRGKPPGKAPTPGLAMGHRLLCHISDGLFRIPKKGTRCYVILPAGLETTPGAGVIVACVSKSPTTQFEPDRVVLDYGDDTHVVFKGKSVSLSDHASPSRSISVGTPRTGGTPGVLIHLPDGTGAVWQAGAVGIYATQSTLMQFTPSSWEVQQAGGSFVKLDGGNFHSFGAVNKMQGAGCYIGKTPTALNPVLWGVSGIAGLPATGVFVSPV